MHIDKSKQVLLTIKIIESICYDLKILLFAMVHCSLLIMKTNNELVKYCNSLLSEKTTGNYVLDN